MRSVWLCILSGRKFEETFKNTQWRKVKQMQPVRLCILSNKQIWMMLVVVKVVRSARCSPLLIKWPPPISHYLVCCRFTMTWSVSDSQLSWVTIMGLFSLSPPPNYFQMLGCNLQREWKDLCMVTILWYVCVCMYVCAYGQERSHPGFRDRSFGSWHDDVRAEAVDHCVEYLLLLTIF